LSDRLSGFVSKIPTVSWLWCEANSDEDTAQNPTIPILIMLQRVCVVPASMLRWNVASPDKETTEPKKVLSVQPRHRPQATADKLLASQKARLMAAVGNRDPILGP
jgi:hypothetical protein